VRPKRGLPPARSKTSHPDQLRDLRRIDRKSLLLGTALASTLAIGYLLHAAPAEAQIVEIVQNANVTQIETLPGPGVYVDPNDIFVVAGTSTLLESDIVVGNGLKIPSGTTPVSLSAGTPG
jgi:hypothetical protein